MMTNRTPTPGPLALVGSGEYLPVMAGIEGGLLAGRPPRYVQLATAAVPDGAAVVAKWHRLGGEQAARLGVEQIILNVESRADANDEAVAALVDGAGLIYLSGGHPAFLAETLRDTAVWRAIEATWRAGAALAGCSAGAMALGEWVPTFRTPRADKGVAGLGLLPGLRVIPHFDAFFSKAPDVVSRFLAGGESGATLIGIDEETALVGGPHEWEVQGSAQAWLLTREGRTPFDAGTKITLP
jgi:cyanophycinase-like exopeptidase